MRIDDEFEVDASIQEVWDYLLDVEQVAPCMPGAELTETVDDRTWKGRVNVKMGPIAMSFAGTVVLQERDDQAHRVVLKADGREQKGKGAASAMMTGRLESVEGGTKVSFETDITVTGAAAQYGRGMLADVSKRLTREFAECVRSKLRRAPMPELAPEEPEDRATGPRPPVGATAAGGAAVAGATAPPLKGIRLGLWALWRAVVRFFRRLFGAEES